MSSEQASVRRNIGAVVVRRAVQESLEARRLFADVPDVIPRVTSTLFNNQPITTSGAMVVAATATIGDTTAVPKNEDVDLYRLELRSGKTIGIDSTNLAENARSEIAVFDANGNKLAAGDSANEVKFTPTASGTYYVGVSGDNNAGYTPVSGTGLSPGATGGYTLSVTNDPNDPPNVKDDVVVIRPDQFTVPTRQTKLSYTIDVLKNDADDKDGINPATLQIYVDPKVAPNTDTSNGSGTRVENGKLIYVPKLSGLTSGVPDIIRYVVSDKKNQQSRTATVIIQIAAAQKYSGSTLASPSPISTGTASLTLDAPAQYFKWTATKTGLATFTTTTDASAKYEIGLSVIDAFTQKATPSTTNVGATRTVSLNVLAGQSYVVQVSGSDGAGTVAKYTLTIKAPTASPTATTGSISGATVVDDDKNHLRNLNTKGVVPGVIYVLDASGSTQAAYGNAGTALKDLNVDGRTDVLDAEIAGFLAYNDKLIAAGLGNVARVAVIGFDQIAQAIDLDPVTPGVQRVTTAGADKDNDGIDDVTEALLSVTRARFGGNTDFGNALAEADGAYADIGEAVKEADTTLSQLGAATLSRRTVVFMSDGNPNQQVTSPTDPGLTNDHSFDVDLKNLQQSATIYAFEVGSTFASKAGQPTTKPALQRVVLNALNPSKLTVATVLTGPADQTLLNDAQSVIKRQAADQAAGIALNSKPVENTPVAATLTLYRDANNDGVFQASEKLPNQAATGGATYAFAGLLPGRYEVQAAAAGYVLSYPATPADFTVLPGQAVTGADFGFVPVVANRAPSVAGLFASPSVIAPSSTQTILLYASGVSDPDGKDDLKGVQFFAPDGTLLGEDDTSDGGYFITTQFASDATTPSYTFSARAVDQSGATSPLQRVTIKVISGNRPPVFNSIKPYQINEGTTLTLDPADVRDADDQLKDLTFVWTISDPSIKSGPNDQVGKILYTTPKASQLGPTPNVLTAQQLSALGFVVGKEYKVTLVVSGGLNDDEPVTPFTTSLNINNVKPTALLSLTVSEGAGKSESDPLVVDSAGTPTVALVDANTGTPGELAGDVLITGVIKDPGLNLFGEVIKQTVTITAPDKSVTKVVTNAVGSSFGSRFRPSMLGKYTISYLADDGSMPVGKPTTVTINVVKPPLLDTLQLVRGSGTSQQVVTDIRENMLINIGAKNAGGLSLFTNYVPVGKPHGTIQLLGPASTGAIAALSTPLPTKVGLYTALIVPFTSTNLQGPTYEVTFQIINDPNAPLFQYAS